MLNGEFNIIGNNQELYIKSCALNIKPEVIILAYNKDRKSACSSIYTLLLRNSGSDARTTSTGSFPVEPSQMVELLTLSPICKGEYPRSHPSGHYPQLVTVGEGRAVDRQVKWELCFHSQLSLHHLRLV